jgi:hypothetical protein
MTAEEWALAASALFAGLGSGLLSTIMRPMLQAMDARDFRNFMGAFLRFAEQSWGRVFNFAWSLGMGLGPRDRRARAPLRRSRLDLLRAHRDRPGCRDRRYIRGLERVERTALQGDLGLGSRGHPGELGGGTAALLYAQLDPIRDDLVGVRPLPGGSGLPLGGPAARRP